MIGKYLKGNSQKGAMALGSILALSAILLASGLALALSGFIQGDIVFNQDKANGAFYIADAGVKDAMQKIARNKNYESAGYDLVFAGDSKATIVVTPSAGKTEIISTGLVGSGVIGGNTKKIRAVVNVSVNGEVTPDTWREITN